MVKVSVIIPCYNASLYLDKCLNVILNDSLKEKEIILINDGSTDNTLEIIKDYQKSHPEIVVLNQKNSGQAVARNNGLKVAKGQYIMFVDVDDFLENNAIKVMYDIAQKNNSDYVFSDYYEHYKNKEKVILNNHSLDIKKNVLLANFAPWAKLISHNLLKEINFSFCEGKIFEDIAVIPYLAFKAKNPYYLNKPLYYYNMSNLSTTRKKVYKENFVDIIFASDYLYNKFINEDIKEFTEEIKFIFLDGILKSGVLKFAKYREGLKNIKILRENVLEKFPDILNNKYYKNENFYNKFTTFASIYFPPYILFMMKKVKK